MTISIWRYSHLLLALSTGLFLILASITGIILAFEPIQGVLKPYNPVALSEVTLAETIGTLQAEYEEVLSIEVDANDFVLADVLTYDGEGKRFYIHPKTGESLGEPSPQHPIFQFTTNLHRSLFLKSVGRFFVGLVSFLLCLIAITGLVLIIKRQGGISKLFSKVHKDYFELRYHVILGRWFLVPILILAATGAFLFAEKFSLLPSTLVVHERVNPDLDVDESVRPQELDIFKTISLADVRNVNFPFTPFPEDYFEVALRDKEIYVHQYTGEILSEKPYPFTFLASKLSLTLHTGQGSMLWSLVLLLASASLLFFIYSGFVMWRKRIQNSVKFNHKNADVCSHVILVGSETGTTFGFAKLLEKALNKMGKEVLVCQLNEYKTFKKAEHLFILTATYGEGDPPTNARNFMDLLETVQQPNPLKYAVIGFGSTLYPNYCKYAIDVEKALAATSGFEQTIPIYKIDNQSYDAFREWAIQWSKATGEHLELPAMGIKNKIPKLHEFEVVSKIEPNRDDTFLIRLKAKGNAKFQSGDLLEYRPTEDGIPRWFSIAKLGQEMLLSIKKHEFGIVSNYLDSLKPLENLKAGIKANPHFHFPKKAKEIICISNGTGIAPFLGIIAENNRKIPIHMYWGGRYKTSLEIYTPYLEHLKSAGKLKTLEVALSRTEGSNTYVQDLVKRDSQFISKSLKNGAVVMICGALRMQKDVLEILEKSTLEHLATSLCDFEAKGQLKMDCY
ncbi:PepSY domain-containing protein [Maribacter flavus]|uniref:NADPH--hemoprotein reductase n=1 Tax=Maribacter flavus TaxID=1658664 RepID=A0A5B2TUI5_9FLAO|nr:PepSY domain-containing protein [Maribacter flavus]KAA2218171.1 oxidoreductase [Maribacter flavus]